MTRQEYAFHRKHAKAVWQITGVGSYGLCTQLPDGRIKIEGYAPVRPSALTGRQLKALQSAGVVTDL